jgi:hypothetical protein
MISNDDNHHEGVAGNIEPPTTSSHKISSARAPSPIIRFKGYLYSKTIMGRGLVWAHVGTTRYLIPRDEDE